MSYVTSEHRGTLSRLMEGDRRGSLSSTLEDRLGPHPGWVIAGLVVLGIGLSGWYLFGPDVRRYIKIRNM
jgi:hypothetical protein